MVSNPILFMSDTPKTDEAQFNRTDAIPRGADWHCVESNFARKLERENNALRAVVHRIRKNDCGRWMSDGEKGRAKRLQLMKLLDELYEAAGESSE